MNINENRNISHHTDMAENDEQQLEWRTLALSACTLLLWWAGLAALTWMCLR